MIYAFFINSLIVAIAVVVHYEILYRLSLYIPEMKMKHRFRIVICVFGTFIAHVMEVWLFAVAYYFMNKASGWGELQGNFDGSLLDCGYFSFTVYSTVGFGDVVPLGSIRFLTGVESLLGLILITWSASFLYLQMEKEWKT
ncbi:ion channel [Thalassotalea piscium]